MTQTSRFSEQDAIDEKVTPANSRQKEKLPYWLIVLMASILAIILIWVMMIVIYPSIALS